MIDHMGRGDSLSCVKICIHFLGTIKKWLITFCKTCNSLTIKTKLRANEWPVHRHYSLMQQHNTVKQKRARQVVGSTAGLILKTQSHRLISIPVEAPCALKNKEQLSV